MAFATIEDRRAIEAEGPWAERDLPRTVWQMLNRTADAHGPRPAITFQLTSGPDDKSETLSWNDLRARTAQMANLLRELGVAEDEKVAYLLPNCNEAVVTYLGGMVAGIVAPINPMLEPAQITSLLNQTGARVLVTLRSFPRSDLAQKAAAAVAEAPNVRHVIEIDLRHYLSGVKKLVIPFLRPKLDRRHDAKVHAFDAALDRQNETLDFEDRAVDRICTNFHTGGTTGMPKLAQHKHSGIIYNGWIGQRLLFDETDTMICPLPMFHVFAAIVVMGSSLASGAHVVFPTPAGYRGDGVIKNFWKLCERHGITFMITVPTAMSALMQQKVDADISKLKIAFCGSAPLPVELYRRFETAANVTICEGYGLTEATCLVSCNPPEGRKKIGSIGLAFPHTDVKIFRNGPDGPEPCPVDSIGEICVDNPGVHHGSTYADPNANRDLFYGKHLRTGDLGRIDEDGYLWITGRAKDLIIRGGHNIDPAEIEEALAGHEAVAMVGAIGQPDAHSGELPCAYVELCSGATASVDELMAHSREHIHERAAWPKYIEILDELPKTAVGKVFKPDLRRRAIARVYDRAFSEAGLSARVAGVVEDKKHGLAARIATDDPSDRDEVTRIMDLYPGAWDWADG
ncbi:acyl-CoA synthetase [Palleronia sp. LCG004]|uniref:acyl-CoA synthetase n=1 Tax=Palleronia sp. LCG004 TaxID=3079304 RepID=UPI002941DA12|nr:acyl-CoA synthetase [Palleronia sp. LCG004]WOI56675.1 acyl-CoA synthetase [Palleronia sp. LCG004]